MASNQNQNAAQGDKVKTQFFSMAPPSSLGSPEHILNFFYKRPTLWALGILAAMVLALFGKALFSQDILISSADGDLANQFYAWRDFGFSELKKGHLAFWNPYIYCGAPFFAGFQSALLYPPNWFFMLLPLTFALNFSIALHVFLAGFFMYLWLAKSHFRFIARLFGSIAFMFGGAFFLHVYPGHLTNLCTMAWIPLVFLMVDGQLKSPSPKWVLGGAAVLSMELLAGHAQYFVYTLFFAGLYALALILLDRARWVAKVCGGLSMAAGSLVLTTVQWLPGLLASKESLREAPSSLELQQFFSFHPMNLLTLAASGLNGNPHHFSGWGGGRIWWESSLFIGSIAILLAFYGLIQNPARKSWVLTGLALVSLIFAMGFYTPVYPILYDWVPPFNFFRGSFKAVIFFQLAFSFLASLGIQTWFSGRAEKFWPAWMAFLLGFILLAAGLGIYEGAGLDGVTGTLRLNGDIPFPPESPQFPTQVAAVRIVNLVTGAGFLFFFSLFWILARSHPIFRICLVLLGMVNLWFFAHSTLRFFSPKILEGVEATVQNVMAPGPGENRIYWKGHDDLAMSFRKQDIWGDDPFLPKRYGTFITYGDGSAYEKFNPNPTFSELLLLTTTKIKLTRLRYMVEDSTAGFKVEPVPGPVLPRAILIGLWEKETDASQAMMRLNRKNFDPTKVVLLEKEPIPSPEEGTTHDQVSLRDTTTDMIEVEAQTSRPQVLLVTENYALGWKALACPDSSQQHYEVIPGDVIARAIPLSAGKHHFFLNYDPPGFSAGKWISTGALLAYFGVLGWFWRKKTWDQQLD